MYVPIHIYVTIERDDVGLWMDSCWCVYKSIYVYMYKDVNLYTYMCLSRLFLPVDG